MARSDRPLQTRRRETSSRGWASAACFGALLACGGGPHTEGGPGGASSESLSGGVDARELPYAPCPEEDAVGEFVIELASAYTRVGGKVSDGVLPTLVPEELVRAGDCRLLTSVPVACDPACPVATEVCSHERTCIPLPRARDVGTVSVHGMVVPLAMSPNAVTRSYTNPGQPPLPNPGFLAGTTLRLTTSGGDYAPFELWGWGVSALELDPAPIEIAAGVPARVRWRAPEDPGPARLHVNLNINHHGSSSAWIECDFPDTGAAEIPPALIDGLMAEGLSGFPTLTATRRTATSTQIEPGCVELFVLSEVQSSVEVEGIISCDASRPCPSGQSCLPVERFCQ